MQQPVVQHPVVQQAPTLRTIVEVDDERQTMLDGAKFVQARERTRAVAAGATYGTGLFGKVKNFFLGTPQPRVEYIPLVEPTPTSVPYERSVMLSAARDAGRPVVTGSMPVSEWLLPSVLLPSMNALEVFKPFSTAAYKPLHTAILGGTGTGKTFAALGLIKVAHLRCVRASASIQVRLVALLNLRCVTCFDTIRVCVWCVLVRACVCGVCSFARGCVYVCGVCLFACR